jgi:hypothetical protein
MTNPAENQTNDWSKALPLVYRVLEMKTVWKSTVATLNFQRSSFLHNRIKKFNLFTSGIYFCGKHKKNPRKRSFSRSACFDVKNMSQPYTCTFSIIQSISTIYIWSTLIFLFLELCWSVLVKGHRKTHHFLCFVFKKICAGLIANYRHLQTHQKKESEQGSRPLTWNTDDHWINCQILWSYSPGSFGTVIPLV